MFLTDGLFNMVGDSSLVDDSIKVMSFFSRVTGWYNLIFVLLAVAFIVFCEWSIKTQNFEDFDKNKLRVLSIIFAIVLLISTDMLVSKGRYFCIFFWFVALCFAFFVDIIVFILKVVIENRQDISVVILCILAGFFLFSCLIEQLSYEDLKGQWNFEKPTLYNYIYQAFYNILFLFYMPYDMLGHAIFEDYWIYEHKAEYSFGSIVYSIVCFLMILCLIAYIVLPV